MKTIQLSNEIIRLWAKKAVEDYLNEKYLYDAIMLSEIEQGKRPKIKERNDKANNQAI